MLRVYCDFNDCAEDNLYWILSYKGKPLHEQVDTLKLGEGQRILLYQDEDDFEVEAQLLFNPPVTYYASGKTLYAKPDWKTFRKL